MTTFMPIAYDMNNKQVLIIGAGTIALRKAKKFLSYNATVTVVAPCILPEFHFMDLTLIQQPFSFNLLEGVDMVVVCTSDGILNNQIAHTCIQKKILVNNCSSQSELNIKMMEIVQYEDAQIAIMCGKHNKRKRIVEFIKKCLQQFSSQ